MGRASITYTNKDYDSYAGNCWRGAAAHRPLDGFQRVRSRRGVAGTFLRHRRHAVPLPRRPGGGGLPAHRSPRQRRQNVINLCKLISYLARRAGCNHHPLCDFPWPHAARRGPGDPGRNDMQGHVWKTTSCSRRPVRQSSRTSVDGARRENARPFNAHGKLARSRSSWPEEIAHGSIHTA